MDAGGGQAQAIAAAWFYTGGKKPYGYLGLGELFVFVFFGLVAVNGTAYAITQQPSWVALLASVAIGLLAVALMLTNNLRDIPTDVIAGKRTLAVRLGDRGTRLLYTAALLAPFALMVPVIVAHLPVALVLLALPLAIGPVQTVLRGAQGKALIPVLGRTGQLELVYSVLLLIGLLLDTVGPADPVSPISPVSPVGIRIREVRQLARSGGIVLPLEVLPEGIFRGAALSVGVRRRCAVEERVLELCVLVGLLLAALGPALVGRLPAHRRGIPQSVQEQDGDQHGDQRRQHACQHHPDIQQGEQPPEQDPQSQADHGVEQEMTHGSRVVRPPVPAHRRSPPHGDQGPLPTLRAWPACVIGVLSHRFDPSSRSLTACRQRTTRSEGRPSGPGSS